MADEKNNINNFTAEDLQRYHAGTLSALQRHALEKAALDDPFLAEALEGYAFTSQAKEDVQTLRVKLAGRMKWSNLPTVTGTRKRLWTAIRIAALFIILIGAGWFLYTTSLQQKRDIALETNAQNESGLSKDPGTDTMAADSVNHVGSTSAEKEENAVAIHNSARSPNTRKLIHNEQRPQRSEANEEAAASTTDNSEGIPLSGEASQRASDLVSLENRPMLKSARSDSNLFKGQVVDESNIPIPSATIRDVANPHRAVNTDIDGTFSIIAADTALNVSVVAIGFYPVRQRLNKGANPKIVIKEDSSVASESVAVGYGERIRNASAKAKRLKGELEPVEGWQHFNAYVDQNIKSLEASGAKLTKGEVQLSFEIDKKQKPIHIKIEKSLCEPCDKEAIRLLKEGPGWKGEKGKRGSVTITFRTSERY